MAPISKAKTFGVSIECPPGKAYGFISDPQNLPKWATAFCQSVRRSGDEWIVQTQLGPMKLRFVGRNEHRVLDHYVSPTPGQEILNPMRVMPNGSGSEVIFTLFQLPEMSDDRYAEDLGLVERDLRTLKNVLESDLETRTSRMQPTRISLRFMRGANAQR